MKRIFIQREKLYKLTKMKFIKRILFILSLLVFVYSAFMITTICVDYFKGNSLYSKIESIYNNAQNNSKNDSSAKSLALGFAELKKINSDTVGWLKIPNCNIDYPVVQTNNNSFYLEYGFDKKKSRLGCLFLDFKNSITTLDKNSVIYGHNMKDVSMFHDLLKYNSKDFFNNNSIISFDFEGRPLRWEVFSVYESNVSFNYTKTKFASDGEYVKFLSSIKRKSYFTRDIVLNKLDKILTLSTCSYDFKNARFVVHAKLIK